MLALPIMFSARSLGTRMMAYFLEGPFIVYWTFLVLLTGCAKAALYISRTFLFGRAGKASLILRAFITYNAAWAYDMWELPLVEIFCWSAFVFSKISFKGQGGIEGGTLLMWVP